MRKRFWVAWGVFVCALIGSYFRPVATDVQLTRTVWGQVCVADGGVRLLVLRGDSSASWTAATVIERDQDTWRHMLFTAPFGRIAHQSAVVDTTGTRVDTHRVDVPLLVLLLMIPVWLLAKRAIKRWVPPPRLIWDELWAPQRDRRRVSGIVRRSMLGMSAAMALGAAVLWAGSRAGVLGRRSYFTERFALVMTKYPEMDYARVLYGVGSGGLAMAKRSSNGEEGLKSPGRHFSIELLPGRVALRYYEADGDAASVAPIVNRGFAGFDFRQGQVPAPTVTITNPLALLSGGVVARGTERTVSARFWALVLLFGLWPLTSFLRGPVRRARRRAAGCCRQCGYDLTGNMTGVCSECGLPVGDAQDGRR